MLFKRIYICMFALSSRCVIILMRLAYLLSKWHPALHTWTPESAPADLRLCAQSIMGVIPIFNMSFRGLQDQYRPVGARASLPVEAFAEDSKKLQHGTQDHCCGLSFFGLGLLDGHVPTCWLLP